MHAQIRHENEHQSSRPSFHLPDDDSIRPPGHPRTQPPSIHLFVLSPISPLADQVLTHSPIYPAISTSSICHPVPNLSTHLPWVPWPANSPAASLFMDPPNYPPPNPSTSPSIQPTTLLPTQPHLQPTYAFTSTPLHPHTHSLAHSSVTQRLNSARRARLSSFSEGLTAWLRRETSQQWATGAPEPSAGRSRRRLTEQPGGDLPMEPAGS